MSTDKGSPLTFTPDVPGRWAVTFSFVGEGTPTEPWDLPVLGWAVVVTWNTEDQRETAVQPVVIDEDGRPSTVDLYLAEYRQEGEPVTWRIKPGGPA